MGHRLWPIAHGPGAGSCWLIGGLRPRGPCARTVRKDAVLHPPAEELQGWESMLSLIRQYIEMVKVLNMVTKTLPGIRNKPQRISAVLKYMKEPKGPIGKGIHARLVEMSTGALPADAKENATEEPAKEKSKAKNTYAESTQAKKSELEETMATTMATHIILIGQILRSI